MAQRKVEGDDCLFVRINAIYFISELIEFLRRCARSLLKFALCSLPAAEWWYVHAFWMWLCSVFCTIFLRFTAAHRMHCGENLLQMGRLEFWMDIFTQAEAKITPMMKYVLISHTSISY